MCLVQSIWILTICISIDTFIGNGKSTSISIGSCTNSSFTNSNTIDSGLTCASCSASGSSIYIYPTHFPSSSSVQLSMVVTIIQNTITHIILETIAEYIYPNHFPSSSLQLSMVNTPPAKS